MARVLFSFTDAQLLCLEQLRAGADRLQADARTLSGLRRRGLIAQDAEAGRDRLTAQGTAVLALCEKLAIRPPTPKGGRG